MSAIQLPQMISGGDEGLYSVLLTAFILFIIIPIIFSRLLGWRGEKAQFGLVIIAALYWIYIWYAD
jgi:hypothetical protein